MTRRRRAQAGDRPPYPDLVEIRLKGALDTRGEVGDRKHGWPVRPRRGGSHDETCNRGETDRARGRKEGRGRGEGKGREREEKTAGAFPAPSRKVRSLHLTADDPLLLLLPYRRHTRLEHPPRFEQLQCAVELRIFPQLALFDLRFLG